MDSNQVSQAWDAYLAKNPNGTWEDFRANVVPLTDAQKAASGMLTNTYANNSAAVAQNAANIQNVYSSAGAGTDTPAPWVQNQQDFYNRVNAPADNSAIDPAILNQLQQIYNQQAQYYGALGTTAPSQIISNMANNGILHQPFGWTAANDQNYLTANAYGQVRSLEDLARFIQNHKAAQDPNYAATLNGLRASTASDPSFPTASPSTAGTTMLGMNNPVNAYSGSLATAQNNYPSNYSNFATVGDSSAWKAAPTTLTNAQQGLGYLL